MVVMIVVVIEVVIGDVIDEVALVLDPLDALRFSVAPFMQFILEKGLGERVSVSARGAVVVRIVTAVEVAVAVNDVRIVYTVPTWKMDVRQKTLRA